MFVEGAPTQGIVYAGGAINDLSSSNALLKIGTLYHGLVILDKVLVFGCTWTVQYEMVNVVIYPLVKSLFAVMWIMTRSQIVHCLSNVGLGVKWTSMVAATVTSLL